MDVNERGLTHLRLEDNGVGRVTVKHKNTHLDYGVWKMFGVLYSSNEGLEVIDEGMLLR